MKQVKITAHRNPLRVFDMVEPHMGPSGSEAPAFNEIDPNGFRDWQRVKQEYEEWQRKLENLHRTGNNRPPDGPEPDSKIWR
jgi:hypothetical protein